MKRTSFSFRLQSPHSPHSYWEITPILNKTRLHFPLYKTTQFDGFYFKNHSSITSLNSPPNLSILDNNSQQQLNHDSEESPTRKIVEFPTLLRLFYLFLNPETKRFLFISGRRTSKQKQICVIFYSFFFFFSSSRLKFPRANKFLNTFSQKRILQKLIENSTNNESGK